MPRAPGNPGLKAPGRGPTGPGGIRPRVPVSQASGLGRWAPWDLPFGIPAYVRKTGSDANGGTSPSDAWLTVNHALQTAAPGSVIYVGAGVYRETVQVTIVPTPSLPVFVVGDVDGAFTGDAGMVQLTGYTTNDTTTPSTTTLLDMNGRSNIAFLNIFFVGGKASLITATAAVSQQIMFRDCAFLVPFIAAGATRMAAVTSAYGLPLNWLFDRCYMMGNPQAGTSNMIVVTLTGSSAGPHYDANFVVQNSVALSGGQTTSFISQLNAGGIVGQGGGVRVRNCTIIGHQCLSAASNASTSFPSSVYGCLLICNTNAVTSTNTGAVIEDYNVYFGPAQSAGVTAGAHSIVNGNIAQLFHFGQERIWGGYPRPFGEAMAASPLKGFGSLDALAGYIDGRKGPRQQSPVTWDLGPYMRGNNFTKETGTVHTGTNAISLVGNGFQDFDLAVDVGTLTVSIYCQRDASYTGQPPQLQILQNEAVGVGTNTVDFTPGSIAAWEQQSLTISPTAKGVVTVRVVSNDTSGIAKTVFDTFAAA